MPKCKICGKQVTTAPLIHRECWEAETNKLAQVFCNLYCRWPIECKNQPELDEHCGRCHLIQVMNLGL